MDITWNTNTSIGAGEGSSSYLRQIVLGRLSDFFRLEELLGRFKGAQINEDDADTLFIDMLDICERLHQEPLYFSFYETYLKSKHQHFEYRELDCKRLSRVVEEERLNYLKTLPRCLSQFSQTGELAS